MPNRLAPPPQNALLTSVPQPYSPATFVPAPTRFNALREAENLSIGLGSGFRTGLEGTKQLLTQPVATARALVEAARQVGTDPRIVLDMLRAARQKAMSGSLGLGELIGENLTPGVRGRKPIMAKMSAPESELTRRAKQFQEIKDAAMGKIFSKYDDKTGSFVYPNNRSEVIALPNVMGNYTGDATLKRKVGNGEIHLEIKNDADNNIVGDENGFGKMHVYLSAQGDVPKGTGTATEMYLEALAIAQQKGLGFVSDSIRSENAENIYRRLIKKGVPFKKGSLYENKSWVLTSDEVAKLDLPAIAAKPYK